MRRLTVGKGLPIDILMMAISDVRLHAGSACLGEAACKVNTVVQRNLLARLEVACSKEAITRDCKLDRLTVMVVEPRIWD